MLTAEKKAEIRKRVQEEFMPHSTGLDRRPAIDVPATKVQMPAGDHHLIGHAEAANQLRRMVVAARAGRQPTEAARVLIDMVNSPSAAAVRELILFNGALHLISEFSNVDSSGQRRASANPHHFDGATVRSVGNAKLSVMDRWMVGGKSIGDCTRAELSTAANSHEMSAQAHSRRAKFYRDLARRVGNKPVRDALSLDQFNEIRRSVFGSDSGE